MKLGMFMMPYHDPRRDLHQALHEDVEVAVHADRAGIEELWVGEHYSAPSEPITDVNSAPHSRPNRITR